jgi:hypothetical protein
MTYTKLHLPERSCVHTRAYLEQWLDIRLTRWLLFVGANFRVNEFHERGPVTQPRLLRGKGGRGSALAAGCV